MQNCLLQKATCKMIIRRNPHLEALTPRYLFSEVLHRKALFLQEEPQAPLISLGVGNTTLPLSPTVEQAVTKKSLAMATLDGYEGYGPESGNTQLKEMISQTIYKQRFAADEIFISDGIGCDLARLQILFGTGLKIAMQDPSYPAYADISTLMGQKAQILLPLLPANDFFPCFESAPPFDLLFFCSPHNPTGTHFSWEQLEQLIDAAHRHRFLIIFDGAYLAFVQNDAPKSIYDIPKSEEVAIELRSFSKDAGFTGVRLSWSVVPHALKFFNTMAINKDWERVVSTCFNGPSVFSQHAAIASLSPEGRKESEAQVAYYLENAALLKEAIGTRAALFGGEVSPYLWCNFDKGSSWETFDWLLWEAHLISVPGSGFGESGEGFVRLSAFGQREQIVEAAKRLKKLLKSGS